MATKSKTADRVDISTRGKTEVITLRLNPKTKFGLELAARLEHRSVSQTVELCIAQHLAAKQASVPRYKEMELSVLIDRLWSPHRGHRLLKMVLEAPDLLSPDEEMLWSNLARTGQLDKYFSQPAESSRRPKFKEGQQREVEDLIEEFCAKA